MRSLHRWILGAGLLPALAGWWSATGAFASGPTEARASAAEARRLACAAPKQVIERFIDARCESCWLEAAGAALPASTWILDWIVQAGAPDAPLSLAALPEAGERLAALGRSSDSTRSATADWSLPPRPTLRMTVEAGPAWNGYLGLQLRTQGPVPAGARAYLALVEELPAGSEGNPVARNLVRSVVGPLVLSAHEPTRELRALRLPENAKPERLRSVAWWLDGEHRLRGMAREGCRHRPASR